MKLIKVAAVALNQIPLDWNGNFSRIQQAVEEARRQGASVICLPELCVTGYGCEDAFHSANTVYRAKEVLERIVPLTKGLIVSVGLPVLHQNGVFNTACLVVDGEIIGFAAKQFLAGDGIHYEPRWFKPWPIGVHGMLDWGNGKSYPIGDLCFDCGGVLIGFEICEGAWVASRPGIALALKGVDIILNPSASHFAFGKNKTRERLVQEGSRAFGVTYVYANLLGNESGRAIYDGGIMIANGNSLVNIGPRLIFQDVQVISSVVDIDANRLSQARVASFQPDLKNSGCVLVRADIEFPKVGLEKTSFKIPGWESSGEVKLEEFSRAEALGLFDYLRKSRSQGFVVSLSGGSDSAACVVLVRLMVELAVNELGFDGFRTKLGHIKKLKALPADLMESPDWVKKIVGTILFTVYQPTENSKPVTRNAAQVVADAVGAKHFVFDVTQIVKEYTSMVETALGTRLSWVSDDLPLQNIQPRVRAPGAWFLANLMDSILLTTSNRSEAAVGYCSMDGDTAGGLGPLEGVGKPLLQRWLRWMEKVGLWGLKPIPELYVINDQVPTAELRPGVQSDEDDLMPYPLLDAIEKAAIRDKRSPMEVFELMRVEFDYPATQLGVWVNRFFQLWSRNQWKRERFAPSFHLDDENLDPKTWCRWPILSANFDVELAELRRYVDKIWSEQNG